MITDSITVLVSKPRQLAYQGLSKGVNNRGLIANEDACNESRMLQCCNDTPSHCVLTPLMSAQNSTCELIDQSTY